MSISALATKLQIKPGMKIVLVNPPARVIEKLRPLPEGAALTNDAEGDIVIGFAKDSPDLQKFGPQAIRATKPEGLLWLCYPKGVAKTGTDLNRDILRVTVEERYGFEGVSLVALDETWSAMRFKPKRAGKTKT